MINSTNNEYFIFNGKKVKFYGIQLSIIDYGDAIAKKFKIKYSDDRKYAFTDEWLTRELYGCIALILSNFTYKVDYSRKNKIPLPWEKKENMTIGLKLVFKNHRKFCSERLKKYLKIYNKGKTAIKKFLDILSTNKKISDIITPADRYYFNIIVNRIVIEFEILHNKLYTKYYKWGLETQWLLPNEECLEILTMTDSKSIIKWFLNKV